MVALLRSALTMFDPHKKQRVVLFQCHKCRKHIWEDETA